jgi:hypothetical protein
MTTAQPAFERSADWDAPEAGYEAARAHFAATELARTVEIEFKTEASGNPSMLSWFLDREHPGKAVSRIAALVLVMLPLIAFVVMTVRTIH